MISSEHPNSEKQAPPERKELERQMLAELQENQKDVYDRHLRNRNLSFHINEITQLGVNQHQRPISRRFPHLFKPHLNLAAQMASSPIPRGSYLDEDSQSAWESRLNTDISLSTKTRHSANFWRIHLHHDIRIRRSESRNKEPRLAIMPRLLAACRAWGVPISLKDNVRDHLVIYGLNKEQAVHTILAIFNELNPYELAEYASYFNWKNAMPESEEALMRVLYSFNAVPFSSYKNIVVSSNGERRVIKTRTVRDEFSYSIDPAISVRDKVGARSSGHPEDIIPLQVVARALRLGRLQAMTTGIIRRYPNGHTDFTGNIQTNEEWGEHTHLFETLSSHGEEGLANIPGVIKVEAFGFENQQKPYIDRSCLYLVPKRSGHKRVDSKYGDNIIVKWSKPSTFVTYPEKNASLFFVCEEPAHSFPLIHSALKTVRDDFELR